MANKPVSKHQRESYDRLLATHPQVERKGKNMLYTSVNGHMFTVFSSRAQLGIRLPKALPTPLVAGATSRTHRPGLPSDPLSASTEDHCAAQGKVVLEHQLHHVSRVHVDHRCHIGHTADQVDQNLDVIAG